MEKRHGPALQYILELVAILSNIVSSGRVASVVRRDSWPSPLGPTEQYTASVYRRASTDQMSVSIDLTVTTIRNWVAVLLGVQCERRELYLSSIDFRVDAPLEAAV